MRSRKPAKVISPAAAVAPAARSTMSTWPQASPFFLNPLMHQLFPHSLGLSQQNNNPLWMSQMTMAGGSDVKPSLEIPAVQLTPNCPGPGFCLFLKFGQAIVIRVLMLNF